MRVRIAVKERTAAGEEIAATLTVNLDFSPRYALEGIKVRRRIELEGVRRAEEWLRTLRDSHGVKVEVDK